MLFYKMNHSASICTAFVVLLILLQLLSSAGCGLKSREPVLEPYEQEADGQAVPGRKVSEEEISSEGDQPLLDTDKDRKRDQAAADPAGPDRQAAAGKPGTAAEEGATPAGNSATGNDPTVTVHVCGAVKKEGVYTLACGSRIRDAVEAAGGFAGNADTSWLNLALQLEDAWQIRVPTREETRALTGSKDPAAEDPSLSRGTTPAGADPFIRKAEDPAGAEDPGQGTGAEPKININTASLEELTQIPGIGESKARRIIEYRETNGRFEAVEDIMNVTGIKENSFRKMRDFITV